MIKNVGIIGGDKRIINIAKLLLNDRFDVYIYGIDGERLGGLPSYCSMADSLENLIKTCDVVLGPIPFSQDDIFIFTPFYKDTIMIESVIELLSRYSVPLIASVIKENTKRLCELYNIRYYDLYEREDLAILNAIPTAEGCIMIAIQEMPITLHSSNVLILGYGRIGRILAKILNSFGCNLYVSARKISDLAWIKALGYRPVVLTELKDKIGQMDLIINTIPALVLNRSVLDELKKEALIIDLASQPGGVDFKYANNLGIKAIHALSLPGKVAPTTAAEYLKEALYNTFKEMEGK